MNTANRSERIGQKIAYVFKYVHHRFTAQLKKIGFSDCLIRLTSIALLIALISLLVMSFFIITSIILSIMAILIIFSFMRGGKTDGYTEYCEENEAQYRDGDSGYGFYQNGIRTDNYDITDD